MSTTTYVFCGEIRKILHRYPLLPVALGTFVFSGAYLACIWSLLSAQAGCRGGKLIIIMVNFNMTFSQQLSRELLGNRVKKNYIPGSQVI